MWNSFSGNVRNTVRGSLINPFADDLDRVMMEDEAYMSPNEVFHVEDQPPDLQHPHNVDILKVDLTDDDFLHPEVRQNDFHIDNNTLELELDAIKSYSSNFTKTIIKSENTQTINYHEGFKKDIMPLTITGTAEEKLRNMPPDAPLGKQYNAWLSYYKQFHDLDRLMEQLQKQDAIPLWVADKMMSQIRGLSYDMAKAIGEGELTQKMIKRDKACEWASLDREAFVAQRQVLIEQIEESHRIASEQLDLLLIDKQYRESRLPIYEEIQAEFVEGKTYDERMKAIRNSDSDGHELCDDSCIGDLLLIWEPPARLHAAKEVWRRRNHFLNVKGGPPIDAKGFLSEETLKSIHFHAFKRIITNRWQLSLFKEGIRAVDHEIEKFRAWNADTLKKLEAMKAAQAQDLKLMEEIKSWKRQNGRWIADSRVGNRVLSEHPEYLSGIDTDFKLELKDVDPVLANIAPSGWISPEQQQELEAGYQAMLAVRQRQFNKRLRGQEKFVRQQEKLFAKLAAKTKEVLLNGTTVSVAKECEKVTKDFGLISNTRRSFLKKPLENKWAEKVARRGPKEIAVSTVDISRSRPNLTDQTDMMMSEYQNDTSLFRAIHTDPDNKSLLLSPNEFPNAVDADEPEYLVFPQSPDTTRGQRQKQRFKWLKELATIEGSTQVAAPAYIWKNILKAIMKKSASLEGLRLHILVLQKKLRKETNQRGTAHSVNRAVGKAVRELTQKFAIEQDKLNYQYQIRELSLKHIIREYEALANKVHDKVGAPVALDIERLLARSEQIHKNVAEEKKEEVTELERTIQMLEEEILCLKRVGQKNSGNLPHLTTTELAGRSSAAMKLRNENIRLKYEIEQLRLAKISLPKQLKRIDLAEGSVSLEDVAKLRNTFEAELEAKDNAITTLLEHNAYIDSVEEQNKVQELHTCIMNLQRREKDLLKMQDEARLRIEENQANNLLIQEYGETVHSSCKQYITHTNTLNTLFGHTLRLLLEMAPANYDHKKPSGTEPTECKKFRVLVDKCSEFNEIFKQLKRVADTMEQAKDIQAMTGIGLTKMELFKRVLMFDNEVHYLRRAKDMYRDNLAKIAKIAKRAKKDSIDYYRCMKIVEITGEHPRALDLLPKTDAEYESYLTEAELLFNAQTLASKRIHQMLDAANEARFEVVALLDHSNQQRLSERKIKEEALADLQRVREDYRKQIETHKNIVKRITDSHKKVHDSVAKSFSNKIEQLTLELNEAVAKEYEARISLDAEHVKNMTLKMQVKSLGDSSGADLADVAKITEQIADLEKKYQAEIEQIRRQAENERETVVATKNAMAYETESRIALESELAETTAALETERDQLLERVMELEIKIARQEVENAQDEATIVQLQEQLQVAHERLTSQHLFQIGMEARSKLEAQRKRESGLYSQIAAEQSNECNEAYQIFHKAKDELHDLKQMLQNGTTDYPLEEFNKVLSNIKEAVKSFPNLEVKMQRKIKELQAEKELLQIRLDNLENTTAPGSNMNTSGVVEAFMAAQERIQNLESVNAVLVVEMENVKVSLEKARVSAEDFRPEFAVSQLEITPDNLKSTVLELLNKQALHYVKNIELMSQRIRELQVRSGAYRSLGPTDEDAGITFTSMEQLLSAFGSASWSDELIVASYKKASTMTLADVRAFWELVEINAIRNSIASFVLANLFDKALGTANDAIDRLEEMTIGQHKVWGSEIRGTLQVLKAWAAVMKGDANLATEAIRPVHSIMYTRWEGKNFAALFKTVKKELKTLNQLNADLGCEVTGDNLVPRCRCRAIKCPLHLFRDCSCSTKMVITPCNKHFALLEPQGHEARLKGLNERISQKTMKIAANNELLKALLGPQEIKEPAIQEKPAPAKSDKTVEVPHRLMPLQYPWPPVPGQVMELPADEFNTNPAEAQQQRVQTTERVRRPAPIDTHRSPIGIAMQQLDSALTTGSSQVYTNSLASIDKADEWGRERKSSVVSGGVRSGGLGISLADELGKLGELESARTESENFY